MGDRDDTAALWGSVAEAWDASVDYVNDISAPATEVLIDKLAVRPGDRLIELAGGPGTLGATWSELVGPDGTVVVSDLAPEMVAIATRRLSSLANVSTAQVDLTAIDRPDGSADVAVCRHGLMFAPEPEVAIAEIHRILAPGGRMGAIVWAGLEHNAWVTSVGMAATVHGVSSGGPPVGPGQLFSLGDPDRLRQLAADAGFGGVEVTEVPFDFTAPDIDYHVEKVVSLAAPLAEAFRSATPEQLAAVRQTVAESSAGFATDDGYVFPGRVLVLTAVR